MWWQHVCQAQAHAQDKDDPPNKQNCPPTPVIACEHLGYGYFQVAHIRLNFANMGAYLISHPECPLQALKRDREILAKIGTYQVCIISMRE